MEGTESAVHAGNTANKGVDGILWRSTRWEAIIPSSSSPFSGPGVDGEEILYIYYGDRYKVFHPITISQPCLLCGSEKVSQEHCTPAWLASALQLMPIVAKVLCETCNNRLGVELEQPLKRLYQAGSVSSPENKRLLDLWAAKSAATLSAAANVRTPELLRISIDSGMLDPQLFVWARAVEAPEEEPFYRFRVLRFPAEREKQGCFVATFEFPGVAVVVGLLPGTNMDYLDVTPVGAPAQTSDIDRILSQVLDRAGLSIDIYADAIGRQPAGREPKGGK